MRKILAIVALGLFLGGCALTTSYNNLLDKRSLANVESAYGITLTAAVTYRDLCAKKIIARATCAPVVAKLQAADRKAQVALKNLRSFVRNNPTLDATSLLLSVKNAVDNFKAIAAANGVS